MGLSKGLDGYNYTYNITNNILYPYGVGSGGTSSTITVDGLAHTMLTFTSTGTFTVTTAGMFDCMIMGGGAAGTQNGLQGNGGGGGGAGALVISQENYFAVGTYVVAVGGGGSISYVGKYASGRPLGPGQGAKGNVGAGDSPIVGGFSGGRGISTAGPNGNSNGGGGGGGMGGPGAECYLNRGYGTMTNGGNGGAGIDWSAWRGEAAGTKYYAAGGGGSGGYGSTTLASGGIGGGGQGGGYYNNNATGGAANTGSGGGGGTEGATARAGGSGIVLIRFRN